MSSKQTDGSGGKKQIPNDWLSASAVGRRKSSEPISEDVDAEFQKMLDEGIIDGISPRRNVSDEDENSSGITDTIRREDKNSNMDSLQTESTESSDVTHSTISKRISGKQRKESLEEYRQTFLSVPKLEDRKPVFVSREVRDRLDEIVRKLGDRRMSVSGFIENLARHHLETYRDDVEIWKKL
jgi:hypothetical protein